jgi:hypothetical protein
MSRMNREGRRTTSPLKRATRRVAMGLGVLAVGVGLGALGANKLTDDTETVDVAAEGASSDGWVPANGPLACAIYDVPSPVYPALPPRSTLSDGAPYVLVCEDSTGSEVVNELFIHQMPDA